MALRFASRSLLVATLCGAVLLSGCANNSGSNPSNYGQRSSDVQAVDATIEREAERSCHAPMLGWVMRGFAPIATTAPCFWLGRYPATS